MHGLGGALEGDASPPPGASWPILCPTARRASFSSITRQRSTVGKPSGPCPRGTARRAAVAVRCTDRAVACTTAYSRNTSITSSASVRTKSSTSGEEEAAWGPRFCVVSACLCNRAVRRSRQAGAPRATQPPVPLSPSVVGHVGGRQRQASVRGAVVSSPTWSAAGELVKKPQTRRPRRSHQYSAPSAFRLGEAGTRRM